MRSQLYTIATIAVVLLAFGVGFGALIYTKKNDSPVEQAAEAVLRSHGIDIDLSPE